VKLSYVVLIVAHNVVLTNN